MIIVIHPKLISFQPRTRLDNFCPNSPYNITFPFWTKNERKKPKAFDFLVNYIFLLLLVCLYSLFLCFKFSYSKCVEFEIDKNIQHWNVDCTEVFSYLLILTSDEYNFLRNYRKFYVKKLSQAIKWKIVFSDDHPKTEIIFFNH